MARLFAEVALGLGRLAHGVAAPLRVGGQSLGALLLLNVDRPFGAAELALVESAISQIDSALQHARTLRELRRRQAELETIYRIDRLRDRLPELQPLLTAVLAEVCAALEAEASFLMLYDQAGHELSLRAKSGRDLFASDTAMDVTVEGVQVLGGYGYVTEYPLERMMRDAKITQIYEGTNEIQRVVIARSLSR